MHLIINTVGILAVVANRRSLKVTYMYKLLYKCTYIRMYMRKRKYIYMHAYIGTLNTYMPIQVHEHRTYVHAMHHVYKQVNTNG